MKTSGFALYMFVISLQILKSAQDCSLVSDSHGFVNYHCDTIQDLERQGNPNAFNVTISNGRPPPPSLALKPSLSVTLSENVGFTNEILGYMKDLSDLWDQKSQLTTLTSRTYGSLPLKSLRMDNGNLKFIQEGTFSQMLNLIEIYITNNDLRSVNKGVFNNLHVQTIALSNNKISVIENNAFSNMKNLKHLYLDGNRISNFQSDTLMNHKNELETLYLQSNTISAIDRNTLKGFDNLRVLNLSNNKINKIFNYSFEQLSNLEILLLKDNFLRELNAEIFPINGLSRLSKFNIANNRLSFLTTEVLNKIQKVEYISVAGNPWHCPCLNLILLWIENRAINQVCDDDYFKGLRPICVVSQNRHEMCDYDNNNHYIHNFTYVNDQFRNRDCSI